MNREHLVILDTNSILQYPKLDGLLKTFLQQSRDVAVRVYVPEVVLDELVCHRERELRDCLRKARSILGKLGKLIEDSKEHSMSDIELPSIERQMAWYTTRLRNTLIRDGDAEQIPYPTVELSCLVKDAGLRVPPFDSNGNNFCDYLIWSSVKSIVNREVTIHFVTGDRKAFGKHELLDSLSAQIGQNVQVLIHPDIGSAMKQVVTPEMQELEKIRDDIENNRRPGFRIWAVIEGQLDKLTEFEIEPSEGLNIPQEASGISVETCATPENVIVVGVWKTGSGTALIEVEFDVECQLEFFVDKFEAVHSDDWEDMSVYDLHWNESVSHVGANRILEVSAYLELDLKDWEPGSLEVVHVVGKDGVP